MYKVEYQLRNRRAIYNVINLSKVEPSSFADAYRITKEQPLKDAKLICVSVYSIKDC